MPHASLKIALRLFVLTGVQIACVAGLCQANPVTLTSGRISGSTEAGVESFKGVPFAAPPVGALRWRAPQPVASWSGTRAMTSYSADCMQVPFPSDAAPLGTAPAEDCLYLNVWRPAGTAPGPHLPVMVWIYGGGFVNGGSSPSVYDGSKMAAQGVVVVSANYRLGRFGFFAFPVLTRRNADGMLGNYAFMDQIAALRWVQTNAAALGGDARNVTVFGESAGGFSVHMLLTSPLTDGLFSKAIVESGGGRSNLGGLRFLSTALPNGPASAESIGVEFARKAGINGTDDAALAALRALPATEVRGDLNMATMAQGGYSGPMIDGTVVVADPQAVYLSGGGVKVPVFVGANDLDIGYAQAPSKEALFAAFGVDEAAARKVYDPSGDAPFAQVRYKVAMDRMMIEPARFVAAVFASRGLPSYEYRFSYVADSLRGKVPGATHASEIPFVFDTVKAHYGDKLTDADEKAAQQVLRYWVAFAKTGAPAPEGLPAAPRYSAASDTLLNFTNNGPVVEADQWKPRLDVTEEYVSSAAPAAPARP